MSDLVRIERGVFDRLLAEARTNPNMECCGLLAGRDGLISAILAREKCLAKRQSLRDCSRRSYLRLFRRMRSEELEHLGIYHSHPKGENSPSPLDIERAFYPEAAYRLFLPASSCISPYPRLSHPSKAQARETLFADV